MKVADLIEALSALPADLDVVVQGYETGFDPVIKIERMELIEHLGYEEWDGEFAAPREIHGLQGKPFPVVAIKGRHGRTKE